MNRTFFETKQIYSVHYQLSQDRNMHLEYASSLPTYWKPCKIIKVRVASKSWRSSAANSCDKEQSTIDTQDVTVSTAYEGDRQNQACEFDLEDAKSSIERARSDSLSTVSSVSLSILAYDHDLDDSDWTDEDDEDHDKQFPMKSSTTCFRVGKLLLELWEDITFNAPKLAQRFDRLALAADQRQGEWTE